MNKNFLVTILKKLSLLKPVAFIDVDMSAAHSRVARYLLKNPKSVLGLSLKEPAFWETQVNNNLPVYKNSDLDLSFLTVKKILKVGLYTSLNGGNPSSDERLLANISLNASKELEKYNLKDVESLKASTFWTCRKKPRVFS